MTLQKPSFIVDAMLGKLAKKLRLLGYDSKYFSDMEDEEIIKIAKDENRFLVTKDEPLVNKATKQKIKTIQITKNEEIEQFLEINNLVKLGRCVIMGSNSRCPKCNGVLEKIEKNLIEEKVPSGIYEYNNDFWICKGCEKIYWEGTHIKNLQKFTEKLNDRL